MKRPARKPTKKKPAKKQAKKPARKPAAKKPAKKKIRIVASRPREPKRKRKPTKSQRATIERAARKRAPRDLRERLREAFATMRDYAGAVTSTNLTIEPAPADLSTLWLMIGHFTFGDETTWLEVGAILDGWDRDDFLGVMINPDRLSQIRTEFDPERGKTRWANLSSVGPWSQVVSDAFSHVDPDVDDSWGNKYDGARALSLDVYFSSELAQRG